MAAILYNMLHSLLREKVQLPPLGPFLAPAIFLTSLSGSLLPPGKSRSLCVTTALVGLLVQFRQPLGDTVQGGLLPIQGLLLFLHWCDFYVLHSPDKEYFRLKDKDKDVTQKSWRGRLGWNFDLTTSLRGVGWNWEVKNVPQSNPTTKW